MPKTNMPKPQILNFLVKHRWDLNTKQGVKQMNAREQPVVFQMCALNGLNVKRLKWQGCSHSTMKELLVVASLYLFSIHGESLFLTYFSKSFLQYFFLNWDEMFIFKVVGISLNLPKVIEVTEMDDVSIPCNVTDYAGNMTLIKFNWMKSMAILQSGQILRIPIISSDKSGTYTCYATIEGQTYNSSVSILVSCEIPSFFKFKKSIQPFYKLIHICILKKPDAPRWIEGALRKFSGAFGSSATLTCLVDSYPSPLFTWIGTDNVSLISSSSKYIIDNIAHKSDLMINSLAQNDYGSYTCGAENKAGKRIYKLQLLIPGLIRFPSTYHYYHQHPHNCCHCSCLLLCHQSFLFINGQYYGLLNHIDQDSSLLSMTAIIIVTFCAYFYSIIFPSLRCKWMNHVFV